MARLLIKSEGFHSRALELRLGVTRIGRTDDNDIQIEHSTISSRHCEVMLDKSGVIVRDCDSTNGTFVNGERIKEASLSVGQKLSLGDVELEVESTDFNIAIPKFEVPKPAPPVVLSDGSVICRRHPEARVTHQCAWCHEMLCHDCVKRMKRRGGKVLELCSLCSHKCEPLGKKKKRSVIASLLHTVKLPFVKDRAESE